MENITPPWAFQIPEGSFITNNPTYEVGKYFDLYEKDIYEAKDTSEISMNYYFFDPKKHGYSADRDYPLLIFLHGYTNALEGDVCINYSGAEYFASPDYQREYQGAYILVPLANEYRDEEGIVQNSWNSSYSASLYALIEDFIKKHAPFTGNKFLFGNSAGARMTFLMGSLYPGYFKALIPVGGNEIPEDDVLDIWDEKETYLFFAMSKHDENNDFPGKVLPRIPRLSQMKHCFLYTPEWTQNGDKGIASINFGHEMGQHCLINSIQANLTFDDGTPMDETLPRGIAGWIDEVNRGGAGKPKEYAPHGSFFKTGRVNISENISLFYEEFGTGNNIILSAQVGFFHRGMQQKLADMGYHVYCITLRGFHPSSLIDEDYGENWYDVFAEDVLSFAEKMNIESFTYMGASHGGGVGWHLMLKKSEKVKAFIAVVAGPHSLKEGTMSYRQMLEQGIIKSVPPFNPTIDNDNERSIRRTYRNEWIKGGSAPFAEERKLDYGRPMMRLHTEENLCEALRSITVPTLLIGGYDDPISTPQLLIRTAGCLPHCKLVIYSNCGHDIDTDLIEEVSDEADRFIKNVEKTGKWYLPVHE